MTKKKSFFKGIGPALVDVKSFLSGSSQLNFLDTSINPALYPLSYSNLIPLSLEYFGPFDQSTIPLQLIDNSLSYVPSRIAGWGLMNYNLCLSSNEAVTREESHQHFLNSASWFALNSDEGLYRHFFPLLNLTPGWISALSQGLALSLLCRAYLITHDTRWLSHLEDIIRPLSIPVKNGGLQSILPNGNIFLEEYPSTKHSYVLNGFLFALVGLSDASPFSDTASHLFHLYLSSLTNSLDLWRFSSWSTYNYSPNSKFVNLNTPNYQVVHASLLHYLGQTSGYTIFTQEAQLLLDSLSHFRLRLLALSYKSIYRLVAGY